MTDAPLSPVPGGAGTREPVVTTTAAVSLLRAAGLRVTAQRAAVLDAVAANPHAPVDGIFETVRRAVPGLALQTVHAVVNDLTTAGVVRRVSLPGADRALYELEREADNHHHVQCISCGRVEDVACVVGHAPCLHPSDAHGMRIVEASITFRGVCAACDPVDQERKPIR